MFWKATESQDINSAAGCEQVLFVHGIFLPELVDVLVLLELGNLDFGSRALALVLE